MNDNLRPQPPPKQRLVLAISGASGSVYCVRLLQLLLYAGQEVHLLVSPAGKTVLEQELGIQVDLHHFNVNDLLMPYEKLPVSEEYRESLKPRFQPDLSDLPGTIFYHHYQNFMAPIASGSFLTSGMVICPCSGSTISGIAHGTSANLIQRAADVHLKEHRKLILMPRETPLSSIQLENMRQCANAGAVILPAMPGFYHGPQSIADLVDFVVARILDQLGLHMSLMKRWGEAD